MSVLLIGGAIVTAGAGISAAAAAVMAPPRLAVWGRLYARGDRSVPRVALTLDDGPTPGATDAALDILAQEQARATFFVVGRNIEQSPQIVRRMYAAGHQIASHSYDHSHFGFLRGRWYWRREIERTDAAIERLIGRRPAMFRPPMGVKSPFIASEVKRAGHAMVTWSVRGRDCLRTSPDEIVGRIAPRLRPGDIILLHDGVEPHSGRDPSVTIAALRPLLHELKRRGLEPVRLDELLALPAYRGATAPPSQEVRACA
jgi:peptidoglycan/xylan/chitin deacetylase (PgdA/CDA1 family)